MRRTIPIFCPFGENRGWKGIIKILSNIPLELKVFGKPKPGDEPEELDEAKPEEEEDS
jgi:hypothetical protein